MKKVMVIATAILFAAASTTSILASGQNAPSKSEQQKAVPSTTKQESQKHNLKAETKTPFTERIAMASSNATPKKHHRKAISKSKVAPVSKPDEKNKK